MILAYGARKPPPFMIKNLFILLLLAAAGLFFGSAYVSTGKFRDALEAKDVKAVDGMVDWPALQASTKDQMREMMKAFLRKRFGDKVVDAPGFDQQLDARLAMTVPKMDANYLVRDAKKRPGKPDAKELVIDSRTWSPVREFKMRFVDDLTAMRFRFDGSGWKLVALEIDPDEAQKILEAQFAEHVQAAQATQAARAAQIAQPAVRPASVRR